MGAILGYRGKGSGGPWWGDDRRRLLFELGARQYFRELKGRSGGPRGEGRYYRLTLDVPGFEARVVEIFFSKKAPMYPKVYVDGPDDSPHRYRLGDDDPRLCMWYPDDPPEQRWIFEDGLHELLALIAAHLFREAWWHEYDEWLGPVSPHATQQEKTD